MQRVDDMHDDLLRAAQALWNQSERRWRTLAERLLRVRPELILEQRRLHLNRLRDRFQELPGRQLKLSGQRLEALGDRLRLLGPDNVLARGYSITQDADSGQVLNSVKAVKSGQKLRTRLADGEVESTVG